MGSPERPPNQYAWRASQFPRGRENPGESMHRGQHASEYAPHWDAQPSYEHYAAPPSPVRAVDGVNAHGRSHPPRQQQLYAQSRAQPPQGDAQHDATYIRPDLRQLYLAVEEAAAARAHDTAVRGAPLPHTAPPAQLPNAPHAPPQEARFQASSRSVLSAASVLERHAQAAEVEAAQAQGAMTSDAFADLLSEAFRRLAAVESYGKSTSTQQTQVTEQVVELVERCEQIATAQRESSAAVKSAHQACTELRSACNSRFEDSNRHIKTHAERIVAFDKQLLDLLDAATASSEQQEEQQVALADLQSSNAKLTRQLEQLTKRFETLEKDHATVKADLETAQGRLKRMAGVGALEPATAGGGRAVGTPHSQRRQAQPTASARSPYPLPTASYQHGSPNSSGSESRAIESLKRDINGEIYAALSARNAAPSTKNTGHSSPHVRMASSRPAVSPPSPVRVGSRQAWGAGSPPGVSRSRGATHTAEAGARPHVMSPALAAATADVKLAQAEMARTPGFMGGVRPPSPRDGLTDADELRAVLDELQQLM